jgi:hypothetical protein
MTSAVKEASSLGKNKYLEYCISASRCISSVTMQHKIVRGTLVLGLMRINEMIFRLETLTAMSLKLMTFFECDAV